MSESFFRLSYNAFGRFCILVKQIAILYSKLRQEVRQMKRKDYHMPKALRIFLDFQMQLEYLFGGNTVA